MNIFLFQQKFLHDIGFFFLLYNVNLIFFSLWMLRKKKYWRKLKTFNRNKTLKKFHSAIKDTLRLLKTYLKGFFSSRA